MREVVQLKVPSCIRALVRSSLELRGGGDVRSKSALFGRNFSYPGAECLASSSLFPVEAWESVLSRLHLCHLFGYKIKFM